MYINSFLSFYLVWNTGIGFGLMSYDQGQIYNGITVVIGIINLIIIYLLLIENNPNTQSLTIYFFVQTLKNLTKARPTIVPNIILINE